MGIRARIAIGAAAAMAVVAPAAAAGSPSIAHGRALSVQLGCTDCHGPHLAGRLMIDEPQSMKLYSANASRALPGYGDAALERLLRTGVRPDGSKLWVMDAVMYAVLTPAELRDLIAYLRTVPPTGEAHPRVEIRPKLAAAIAAGKVPMAADERAFDLAHLPEEAGPEHKRGRYLAITRCNGCHAPTLRGYEHSKPGDPPDLAIAASYDAAAFAKLFHTGKGRDGRELGEMSEAVRVRFPGLPDADREAIRRYLAAWVKIRGPRPVRPTG